MKVELEIISDRLPTEADGSQSGMVFVVVHGVWSIWHWSSVEPGMHWAKIPTPPKPPIDTSLAASIERMEVVQDGSMCMTGLEECDCGTCDQGRLIEAARKWDENQKLIASLCDSDANAIADICGASKSVGATLVDRLAKVEVNDCKFSGVSIRDKNNGKWRPATAADLFNAKVGDQIAATKSSETTQ